MAETTLELNPLTLTNQIVTVLLPDYLSDPDESYGVHPKRKYDVYRSTTVPNNAPWILMVHGGLWTMGDKANAGVASTKADYFCPRGITVISMNYPLTLGVQVEIDAIGVCVADIKANYVALGIDPNRMIIMGHSSGGHISTMWALQNPTEHVAAVILDSASMDMVDTMTSHSTPAHDALFGADPLVWESFSPMEFVIPMPEMLVITSNLNPGGYMQLQNEIFATAIGGTYYPTTFDHAGTNGQVGNPGVYTTTIENFIEARI